jgi:hypothetical protein
MRRATFLCSLAWLAWAAGSQFTKEELEAHKQWMNDAAEQQEEVRDAFAAKDPAKLLAAAKKLDVLTAKEAAFWDRTSVAQAKSLAATNRQESQQLIRAAQAGKMAEARTVFASLEKTCSACHGLQLEKTPALAPRT